MFTRYRLLIAFLTTAAISAHTGRWRWSAGADRHPPSRESEFCV